MNLKIFISYSSVDENIANELARLFDQIGLEYFLDRKDIEWGSHITREIRKGLSECSHVVVIISSASLKSQWVPFEIGHAMGVGKRILPFLTHPSLDLPGYLHDFHHESNFEDVKKYFQRLVQLLIRATEENDYKQRMEDMETSYRSKLNEIMQILQDLQRHPVIIEETKEKKPKLAERRVLEAIVDPYLQQGVAFFDIGANFEYFAAEALETWLSQLRESRDPDVIERLWRNIYERFDKHIVQGVGTQLPRMKEIASKQNSVKLQEIPLAIRNEVAKLAQIYPELIKLIEEFMKMVRKQSVEIEQRNVRNIGRTAIALDRQIKRIQMRANTVARDLYLVVVSVYDQLTEEMR